MTDKKPERPADGIEDDVVDKTLDTAAEAAAAEEKAAAAEAAAAEAEAEAEAAAAEAVAAKKPAAAKPFKARKPKKGVGYRAAKHKIRNPYTGDQFNKAGITDVKVIDSWMDCQMEAGLILETKLGEG